MKKTIYIFILIFFTFKLSSQNINTEIEYLKAVNNQSKNLIKDNIRNAEICALKLIQNTDSFKNIGNLFFEELAKSYYITENYKFVLLTYYRQRCFFPKKEDGEASKYYKNSAERIRKNDFNFLLNAFKETNFEKIPKSYINRFELFLKLVYKSGFKNSDNFELKYSNLYRTLQHNDNLPYWIKQHNFYSKIKIKLSKRKNLYSFTKIENEFFIPKFLTKTQKHKICTKALKYYLHIKNKEMVKKYANLCKENNIRYCLRAKFAR